METEGETTGNASGPRLIRLTLRGPDAWPGRVSASDVARAILGLQRAMQRAAAIDASRRRRGPTGRHTAAIERSADLRLLSTGKGSFKTLLALPDDVEQEKDALPMSVRDLSDSALDRVLSAIQTGTVDVDRELASAVAQMSDELGVGERTTELVIERVEAARGPAIRAAVLDAEVRDRMHLAAEPAEREPQPERALYGTLVEADFEKNTARLRGTLGKPVAVTFAQELADDVQGALRSHTGLEGKVTYDRWTSEARSVDLIRVQSVEQLALGDPSAFWGTPSFRQLQEQQGTTGVVDDFDAIVFEGLTDEDRAALATIA